MVAYFEDVTSLDVTFAWSLVTEEDNILVYFVLVGILMYDEGKASVIYFLKEMFFRLP